MMPPMHAVPAAWLHRLLLDPNLDDNARLVGRAIAAHASPDGTVIATDQEIIAWVMELDAQDG